MHHLPSRRRREVPSGCPGGAARVKEWNAPGPRGERARVRCGSTQSESALDSRIKEGRPRRALARSCCTGCDTVSVPASPSREGADCNRRTAPVPPANSRANERLAPDGSRLTRTAVPRCGAAARARPAQSSADDCAPVLAVSAPRSLRNNTAQPRATMGAPLRERGPVGELARACLARPARDACAL